MSNWLKTKWRWLVGLLIPVAFAVSYLPLGATPSDTIILVIDTNDIEEVRKMYDQASTTPFYVFAYTDLSPEIKAEIKSHKETVEGFWLYRDKIDKVDEDKHVTDIVKKVESVPRKNEIRKESKKDEPISLVPIAHAQRLFSVGFEWHATSTNTGYQLEFEQLSLNGNSFATTSTAHGGLIAVRANTSATTRFMEHDFRADAIADAYLRTYLYIATLPGANVTFLAYCDNASFCGSKLKLQADGGLQCDNDDGTATTNGTATLSTGQWYRIEMLYDETNNDCSVLIDGVADITDAVVNDIGGGGTIRVGAIDSSTTDLYFDDVAVNNTAGHQLGTQTGYPGAGKIVALVPTGAGDSACTAGTFDDINEIPPSNIASGGGAGDCALDANPTTGLFNITDSSTAGIDSYDTINLVYGMWRIREESAGTSNWFGRILSAAAGTATSTASVDAGNATPLTNPNSTDGFGLPKIVYADPSTSVAWTPTGTNSLDNAQIGAGTTDGTPDVWLLTTALMVEYVDGSPPTSSGGVGNPIIWFD